MKTPFFLLSVCASITCAMLVGCSKSDNTPPTGVAGVTPEGQMDMRFRWIVGKQYAFRMSVASHSDLDIPNQKQPMKQDVNMAQDYTVTVRKELPNGGRELELEFTGAEFEMKMGDRVALSFNSTQDPAQDAGNPVAAMLRKTVGGKVTYETDAAGRVDKVTGFQEFTNRVMSGVSPQIAASFGSMYNLGYFKQLCDAARMAPDNNVKPGDTWNRSIREEMGSLGILVVYAKMKFKDWEQHGDRKCACIEAKGDIKSEPAGAANPASPLAMEIEDGKVTSTGWFDPALGMVVESVADQTINLKITTRGQTITSRMKQKVNSKLLNVVDVAK